MGDVPGWPTGPVGDELPPVKEPVKGPEESVRVPKGALQKIHDHLSAIADGAEEGLINAAEIPAMILLLGACLATGRIPGCEG